MGTEDTCQLRRIDNKGLRAEGVEPADDRIKRKKDLCKGLNPKGWEGDKREAQGSGLTSK